MRESRCTGGFIQRYLSKISGPLLDRIDLHVEVPAVPYKEMRGVGAGECSAAIRERVLRARAIQSSRGFDNAQIPVGTLRKLCELDGPGERTLEMAVRRMGLSARAHDRLLKVSRTIADLGGSASVAAKHATLNSDLKSLGYISGSSSAWGYNQQGFGMARYDFKPTELGTRLAGRRRPGTEVDSAAPRPIAHPLPRPG